MLVLALVMSLGLAGTALAASPVDTIKAYFAAAAKGDLEGMKKLTTGRANEDINKATPRDKQIIPGIGAAFQKVTDVKITGDKATAIAHLDATKLAKVMWDTGKVNLAKIKDPKQRAQAEKFMKDMYKKMALEIWKLKVELVKKGGAWLISNTEPLKKDKKVK
ncbi:MAG: hypothetical protein KKC37_13560 [Proteobacteria bacterium]|nr:hypothetical protein [Pseudomonadota bacterium]